jgi:hypothetical protein
MLVGALSLSPASEARSLPPVRAERKPVPRLVRVAADGIAEPPADADGLDADTGGSLGRAPAQILSRGEMVSLSRKHALDLANLMMGGESVREHAVRERDLVRLSCVQEHLLQMKLVKSVANDAVAALARPDVQQDELRLRHEFRQLEMGKQQLEQHLEEMGECVGAETPLPGGPAEIAGQTPAGPGEPDPAAALDVTTLPTERPAAASPIL